jgi:hypothetical protein
MVRLGSTLALRIREEYKLTMRREGVPSWRVGVVVAAAVVAAFAVPPAMSSRTASTVSFQLVVAPTCGSGTTRLGRACVDRPTIPNWTIEDGNARWDMPGQWLTTYSWTVPQTVAAAGGALSLRVSAEERTGRANTRICPALGARAGFSFKGVPAQPVVVGFCAEAIVKPTDAQSKALTLVPPSAAPGSLLYLTIGAQDGPSYTYTYRAGAVKKPKKKPPKRSCGAIRRPSAVTSALQTPNCQYIVTYKAGFHFPKLAGELTGAGTISGPVPSNLKVDDDLAKPGQENLIRMHFLRERVVLDVQSASYSTPKGTKHKLLLHTTVLRSNVAGCPKGSKVIVILQIDDDGGKTFFYSTANCKDFLQRTLIVADENKQGLEINDKLEIDATFKTTE